jgi:hypothetical protein
MSEYEHVPHFRFYLVLKGEIGIFTDKAKGYLRLLAPEVPVHAYVAGPWLGEAQIPRHSVLQLENVVAGHATPADYPDFLLILPHTEPHPERSYFEIIVPFPKAILPGAEQDASGMKVTVINDDGSTELIPMPDQTCLAAILVYEWDGTNEPFLSDSKSGRKWLSGGKLHFYRSLHVCASGETEEEEESLPHAQIAFHKAAAALGVDATIDFGGGGNITPTNPPQGLSFHEINLSYFETLELRQALGELLEGGPGVIPTVGPLHFLGGNCGPIGG